jgi:hypothetical protein
VTDQRDPVRTSSIHEDGKACMAELTVLLPPLAQIKAAGTPAVLARWLARGDRRPDAVRGRDAALRECFEFLGVTLPAAALTRSLDASDAAGALWLRADPAYAVADAVTARLLACGTMDLSREEADALARALQPLFGDAGFPLEVATPSRWYLRCPIGARLPRFAAPADALGDDLMQHLPQGDNERQWRRLLNEAQVILHNHPVNVQRVQRGQIPANSVWFWGPGTRPEWVRTSFTRVFSSDDIAVALAHLANVAVAKAEPAAVFHIETKDTLLLDLAGIRDPLGLERGWLAPLDAVFRRRKLKLLHLNFVGGERFTVKPAHRWRFWRRIKQAHAR